MSLDFQSMVSRFSTSTENGHMTVICGGAITHHFEGKKALQEDLLFYMAGSEGSIRVWRSDTAKLAEYLSIRFSEVIREIASLGIDFETSAEKFRLEVAGRGMTKPSHVRNQINGPKKAKEEPKPGPVSTIPPGTPTLVVPPVPVAAPVAAPVPEEIKQIRPQWIVDTIHAEREHDAGWAAYGDALAQSHKPVTVSGTSFAELFGKLVKANPTQAKQTLIEFAMMLGDTDMAEVSKALAAMVKETAKTRKQLKAA